MFFWRVERASAACVCASALCECASGMGERADEWTDDAPYSYTFPLNSLKALFFEKFFFWHGKPLSIEGLTKYLVVNASHCHLGQSEVGWL